VAKTQPTPKSLQVSPPDPNAAPGKLRFLSGSDSDDFCNIVMNQALATCWAASDESGRDAQTQAVIATMIGLKPQDEAEGMLIAQMIGCHHAAMECFRRAMIPEQPFAGRQQNLSFANKLARTFALHLEALDKHRGKGQQKVTVEHVHVHKGGQAIVGHVQGAGVPENRKDQPHAQSVAYASEQEMRSPFEAEREAMPERSDEER
jgi:hypothetical protein